MASGRTLVEVDDKRMAGFFPKIYEQLVTTMGEENANKLQSLRDDPEGLIR